MNSCVDSFIWCLQTCRTPSLLHLLRCCNGLWSRSCNGIPSSTNMAKIVTNVWSCSRYRGCWYWTGSSWQGSWFGYCDRRFLYCKTFLCINSWSIRVTPLFMIRTSCWTEIIAILLLAAVLLWLIQLQWTFFQHFGYSFVVCFQFHFEFMKFLI